MMAPSIDFRSARIEPRKLTDYLLNPEHPGNGGKAAFFLSLGFARKDWRELATALWKSAQTAEIVKAQNSTHGWKYIQEGVLESGDGKAGKIRMVWIMDFEEDAPRLVTAYPGNEG